MAVKKNKPDEMNEVNQPVTDNAASDTAFTDTAATDTPLVSVVTIDTTAADKAAAGTAVTGDGDTMADLDTPLDDVETVLSDIKESVDSLSGNTEFDVRVHVKKNSFNLTDKIPCKSLFHGKLVYTSPTNGSRYVWNEYGAVQHVPFVELETMNNHKPEILNKPLLLILEPTVVEDFNFGDVYRKVASINKLGTIYKTGKVDVIRAKVKELIEVGMRDSVIADARKRRKENTLVDINIINMLNVELKCDIG